ncbi:hypothetical protein CPJ18_06490 [Agrobacterium rosae]|uniref:Uncharacterized protein n=1 Tax=Agrobacterium rosae TaxID=1972867 RepID=A0AAE5S013_9HYPH|nr:hypothetical protein DXM21_21000 [Agrobacterium rosae]KAA3516456.1 hypothetical protein DXM25_19205 [Agrobacterium rosae]MQB50253.1 hypothetical protein [Agrobacterium rosae]POO52891.1 hypothetical protein CPJ18_06490 [Agrobacterium rosae]
MIAWLILAGWSARTGGGFDFSWASLTLHGIQIDKEFDNWHGGDMAFENRHASKIICSLPADLLDRLKM